MWSMQMEGVVFTTVMMLLDVTTKIHPDSATLIQERAFDIILRADRLVGDLTDHRQLLVHTCKHMLSSISR